MSGPETDKPAQGALGRRTALSRNRILATAAHIADEDGIDGVSLRKVAARLEVTPMALYRYISGKNDLEQHIAQRLLRRWLRPVGFADQMPWQNMLRNIAEDLYRVFLTHPTISRVFTESPFMPEVLELQERVYIALARAGYPVEDQRIFARVFGNFLVGTASLAKVMQESQGQQFESFATEIGRSSAQEKYSHLAAAMAHSRARPPTVEMGIELLIGYVELATKAPQSRPSNGNS